MSLRIGILGAARIAASFMVGAKQCPRVEVVAVGCRDRARGEAFAAKHGVARACTYDELIADRGIDAIYNPLPNGLHAAWSIAAARAGKHVLCEKPLALSEAEAHSMFEAADAANVILLEAFPYMFQPQTLEIERRIAAGEIGEVLSMQGAFGFAMRAKTKAEEPRLDPAIGGGAMFDVGCYPMSFARQIFGARPARVSASARWVDGTDRTLIASLEYPGGGLAQISCSFASAGHRRALIVGTAGIIETDFANHTDREPAHAFRIKRSTDHFAPFESVAVPREDGFKLETEAFVDMIEAAARGDRTAERARRTASLDNAWTTTAILDAARR
ncbi:MAG TPA: Gfo/Idh/MocA family oxidoreductase [Kofleriaceae bacterium]|nr:Gfo/Idh/MocA family oxidoreductase [Kofleriaceae bacterium]